MSDKPVVMEANMTTKSAEAEVPTYEVDLKATSVADARSKIFATRKVRAEVFEFFGTMIELRQPNLGDIVKARSSEDRESGVIETLVEQAYLPGTNEKLFTPEDADSFKAMPFGADFIRVTEALEKLTEVNFRDKKST
jgi:hypothetical protein